MARFNEILAGRYNRMLQKLFVLKGGPPAAQLASEVMPVFQLFGGVENRLLESWNMWAAPNVIPANAAFVGTYQLRMPVGTNVMAVIEKISVYNGGAAATNVTLGVQVAAIDLAGIVGVAPRDTRLTMTAGSTAIASVTSASAQTSGTVFEVSQLPAGDESQQFILTDDQEFVLTPGFAIRIQGSVINQILGVTVHWRERAMEESEIKGN
jgi:hypothetical protein